MLIHRTVACRCCLVGLLYYLYSPSDSEPYLTATAARRRLSPAYKDGGVVTFKDVHPAPGAKVFIIAVPILGPDFAPYGPGWCCPGRYLSRRYRAM